VKAPPREKKNAAERRDAQDEFHSAAQARAWADGDFDADHGFAFDGVGRRIRAGREAPSGWRWWLLCAHPCCKNKNGQDSVRSSDGFDGMYDEGDSDGLDY
jgi:hypothetical protein